MILESLLILPTLCLKERYQTNNKLIHSYKINNWMTFLIKYKRENKVKNKLKQMNNKTNNKQPIRI